MATKKVIGQYQGVPIYSGTDAEVSAQMAAVDASKKTAAPVVPAAITPPQAQPKTQAELDAMYSSAAASHPALAGNSPEAIAYATSTGDYSQLVNSQGQPFSFADQQSALADATKALDPYYSAMQNKDTQDTAAALADKQSKYQEILKANAESFKTEKNNQDQQAVNNGVLFSGGRVQKLKNLENTFNNADTSAMNSTAAGISDTARNFGYSYGDSAANNLSNFYNLGKNTYNANVAGGDVGSTGLSSIYNANQGFQGTVKNTAKAQAQQRAAGLLANKGNKLVASGYTNQF